MARFSSDPGAQKFPTLVDASKATAAGAQSVTGAGTFLRPTPPRSSREGSAAPAGGFRHRHWHSFSDFQDSLDGAYDGDIGDSPCAPRPSTVAAASADAAATSGDVSSLRLNAPPAAAALNSVPPAAASASAVATSPTEAMRPGRSRSHGSDTMARRRLARHRRTQSLEAVMEYYGVTEQALTLTPMGQVQASSVKQATFTGQASSVKQSASMTPPSSSPFPRAYMAVHYMLSEVALQPLLPPPPPPPPPLPSHCRLNPSLLLTCLLLPSLLLPCLPLPPLLPSLLLPSLLLPCLLFPCLPHP
ncbi:unnamed protein product [Closterium sp. Naga37s-1]|nr:unnamed protein product [Closterium sp. Naga37s-1]